MFTKKVTLEKRPKEMKEPTVQLPGGRASQLQGEQGADLLTYSGSARKPVGSQRREGEVRGLMEERSVIRRTLDRPLKSFK